MSTVHIVVPAGIDDPLRPSGGNVYDRRVCDGLAGLGWSVVEHHVAGDGAGLDDALAQVPGGALVLLDGLLTEQSPDVVARQANRLRLVVLLHMPIGGEEERATLTAASAVVTTSQWSRQWVLDHHAVRPDRVHVAEPGVEPADLAPGTPSGGSLVCVGAVTPTKGYDVLLGALADIRDLEWRCVCAGALDLEPGYVDVLLRQRDQAGLAGRVAFVGPLTRSALAKAYAGADVLVSASRAETFGMVITEALARGLPVVSTDVGGAPEALGVDQTGDRPGLLVPPDDPRALAVALRRWLDGAELRESLRAAARARRRDLAGWPVTTERLSRALGLVAEQNGGEP